MQSYLRCWRVFSLAFIYVTPDCEYSVHIYEAPLRSSSVRNAKPLSDPPISLQYNEHDVVREWVNSLWHVAMVIHSGCLAVNLINSVKEEVKPCKNCGVNCFKKQLGVSPQLSVHYKKISSFIFHILLQGAKKFCLWRQSARTSELFKNKSLTNNLFNQI